MYTTTYPEDLIRHRNESLLREVSAERLGSKLRTRRGPHPGVRWLVTLLSPRREPKPTTGWPRWIS